MAQLNGFVKIHRKLVQWGWYTDNVVKGVFLHLLLTANFKNTKWMGKILKKGQLVTSYGRLAAELGFSVRQIRTAIEKLKSTGEIACESTNKYTLITVTNWDEYQYIEEKETSKPTRKTTNKNSSQNSAHRFCEQIVNRPQEVDTQNDTQKCLKKQAAEPFFNSGTKKETNSLTNERQTNDKQTTNKRQQRKKNKYLKDTYSDKEEKPAYAPHGAEPRRQETESERLDRIRREDLRR